MRAREIFLRAHARNDISQALMRARTFWVRMNLCDARDDDVERIQARNLVEDALFVLDLATCAIYCAIDCAICCERQDDFSFRSP